MTGGYWMDHEPSEEYERKKHRLKYQHCLDELLEVTLSPDYPYFNFQSFCAQMM